MVNGCILDGAPSDAVMSRFRARNDNQITSLEMLAISMGLTTFAPELCNRKVIVWADNRGAEVGSRLVPRCYGLAAYSRLSVGYKQRDGKGMGSLPSGA